MFDEGLLDPTAGERARRMREPASDRPEPVTTDPTAGERARRMRELGTPGEIVDPTDPRCGRPASRRGGIDDAA